MFLVKNIYGGVKARACSLHSPRPYNEVLRVNGLPLLPPIVGAR